MLELLISGVIAASTPVSYQAPVPGAVVRAFQPPASAYGPGHRGVDLSTTAAETVRAAGPGTVSFVGAVAGRGVVVLAHPDGVSTEYEPVRPAIRSGDVVTRGEVIGWVEGAHGTCPPGSCLHWGARRAGLYFDPLTLLARLGPVRLLPWADP